MPFIWKPQLISSMFPLGLGSAVYGSLRAQPGSPGEHCAFARILEHPSHLFDYNKQIQVSTTAGKAKAGSNVRPSLSSLYHLWSRAAAAPNPEHLVAQQGLGREGWQESESCEQLSGGQI